MTECVIMRSDLSSILSERNDIFIIEDRQMAEKVARGLDGVVMEKDAAFDFIKEINSELYRQIVCGRWSRRLA